MPIEAFLPAAPATGAALAALRRALNLAARGRDRAAPTPMAAFPPGAPTAPRSA
jgi:hypothetical protein